MDVATLEQLLGEAEVRLYREELGIVRQRELIAALRRQGLDAADATARLRRLESSQARHMADRNRLFQALANASSAYDLADVLKKIPLWEREDQATE